MNLLSTNLRRLRRYASRAQRGATLTGYSLIVATFVTVSLVVIQSLESNSGDFLSSTGNEVGTPRLPRDQVATSLLPPPPAYAAPTLPPSLITYDNEPLGVAALGGCMANVGGVLTFDTCGSANEISVSAHSSDAAVLTLKTSGLCIQGTIATNSVDLAPCSGSTGQDWWQLDPAPPVANTVMYQLVGSTVCIGVATPPPVIGDPAFTLVPCGTAVELEILF